MEGWVAPPGGFPGAARWIAITPGYFEAMSIRLGRGRAFELVLREGALLAGGGLILGMAVHAGLGRVIQNQLYEVQPLDPVAIAVVLLTMSAVAFVACAIPAKRATRLNPAEVLSQGF